MIPKKYVALIDFDNTIARTKYPTIISPIDKMVKFIKELQKKDNWVWTLYTCRVGKELEEAIEWLEKHQLYPDYVNENYPRNIIQFGECRKLSGDIIFDDKAYGYKGAPNPKTFFDEFEKEYPK